jgi:hypothetical protein
MAIPFRHGIHPKRKLFVYRGTEYCNDVFHVHVKIDQLVETGTPISDETYTPINPEESAMPFDVVTSTSRNPGFVTDVDSRKIGNFEVNLPYCELKSQKEVNVKMIFSGTELNIEASDNITNQSSSAGLVWQTKYYCHKCLLVPDWYHSKLNDVV